MLTQSVSWEKTSNMQSQDELYSFLGDRVGGFHSCVVRSGSEGSLAVLFLSSQGHNLCNNTWFSKQFGTVVALEEEMYHLKHF